MRRIRRAGKSLDGSPERINQGWLGPLERPALRWLAPRLPAWVSPDGLTATGLAGALIAAAGYGLAPRVPDAEFGSRPLKRISAVQFPNRIGNI